MIYKRIKNLTEIVGEEACSLTWPLGERGVQHKDYFIKQPYIKTHINCDPSREINLLGDNDSSDGGTCDGFLIRKARRLEDLPKDEIETAELVSYDLPSYYGRCIDNVVEIKK
ncbi:MAG: hypothetical protein JSV39_02185 [Candidatus Aenigmatarchaeota archaeon]|nr:MAG: hypothetical protein JSV39_02185 [Candidatus Aenigmarchaeota archaeon]